MFFLIFFIAQNVVVESVLRNVKKDLTQKSGRDKKDADF
jgi:hypothetical protein